MKLAEMTVTGFADTVASDAPAPGGGSCAALYGSIGAALTAMVGGWLYLRLSAGADRRAVPVRVVLSGIPAEAVMVIGYFLYEMGMEVAMGSNAAAAATAVAVGIPMNIVQGVAGIIVCAVLLPVLSLHKGIVTAKNG